MIEPKIVIFFNLLIAASDYNFGAPVTEWPSRCLADKRNFKKKTTTTTNKQNKTKQKYAASISRHLGPRYGHAILVSGYPVVTAVN